MATIEGSGQGDILTGTDADDVLLGRGGNDRLIGGGGADRLVGGAGRDFAVYLGLDAQTVIVADLLVGSGLSGEAQGDSYEQIEGLVGSVFADRLIGDDHDNWLIGREGDDTLNGNAGNDRISGGFGADTLSGGAGLDWLMYRHSKSAVTVDLGADLAQGGDAQGDVFSGFENLLGSHHDDLLIGTSGANTIRGGFGDDTLRGAGGNDRLNGGWGDDILEGGAGDDHLTGGRGDDLLNGGDGFDTVSYADSDDNISVNTRNGQMLGDARGDRLISIEMVIGTEFGDSIILGDGPSRLVGRGGDDFLDGGNGNDRLIGGAGRDFLHGGSGIDTAIYRGSPEAVRISMENHTREGGHAEGDTLSWIHNLTGSLFDDMLEGDLLNNRLRGLDGQDLLIGRDGADKLVGGAGADTLIGGEGADRFAFVELGDHSHIRQDVNQTLARHAGSDADTITDFDPGTDVLLFKTSEFSGPVVNTDSIADLNLTTATATGFAFTGNDLFYVRFAETGDFDAGMATVHHVATLTAIGGLTDSDFAFV
ncbi:calcium-binding protein [Microbulbifer sp. S227A]|uniref:calcium-binding protein n=1 Tax=Microbulbifer sp. S227A TaxID=3415131 RepID=UPI003C7A1DD1